jgi:hypothetical protein
MTLVGDVVRTQARIKSAYRSRGVLVTGIDVYSSRRREEWLKQLPSGTKIRATRLYAHLDFLLDQKKQAEADLLREGKKHPIVKILETAPGFGPIRAARLVPIVITPHRFRTKRQFWSYCGLGIVTRSSSDWVQTADGAWIKARVPQTRGLSRQHNHFLKSIFKGSCDRSGSGEYDDNRHPTQQRSHSCSLRTTSRWRHEADPHEAELGAHDRSHGAADVEEGGGIRSRASRVANQGTQRLGAGSFGRVDENAIQRKRIREESSHVTHCVAAGGSIHKPPDQRRTFERSHV